MKKRLLAMLLAIVILGTSVGVTTLFTGGSLGGNGTQGVSASVDADEGSGDSAGAVSSRLGTELPDGIKKVTDKDESADTKKDSVLDENNALTVPYDIAYPEAFESEDCLYSGEQIMVKFDKSFRGKLTGAMKKAGMTGLEKIMDMDSGSWYIVFVTGDVKEVMAKVRALKNVKVAEYDYLVESTGTIIDSSTVAEAVQSNGSWRDQWYLRSGNLQLGWDLLRTKGICPGGDSSVTVAVIDTGVDYTHEDLRSNIWTNTKEIPDNGIDDDGNGYVDDVYGVDMVAGSGSGMDDQGHGTHVAGIIAAANNNIGIVGLAYNVKIMPIKAGMASGYFHQSKIAQAILYAYENGADVINMSFGGNASSIAVQDALETAYTRCILVAAAGNDGLANGEPSAATYPAALSYVMGVMSVDEFGVESDFTNYDSVAYNSVEYEVYAPGSQILSTIPGNRYATWSGTSMAAPYVSAMAALLRSYYSDASTYTTRFICGQIAATGSRNAICVKHGAGHNIPKIVDIYNALTKMPRPEVTATNVLVFDDESLSDKNNGDGVIDAGETVALAFTLRNRWGMAKDATVTLDALSQGGISDPYIEFIRSTINYGDVGTYTTQDCGIIRENGVIAGVDAANSLLIKVADDCPNDYIANINIAVTCKNGLDEKDSEEYISGARTELAVRRGVLLPRIFNQDATLTKENYYILPNGSLIPEDVTVTVEAGTQIQFWTDDPNDVYAQEGVSYFRVNGSLICQGSEEERIRLFPSDLMSQYCVQLKGDGIISLSYTDVVNPYLDISYADNCTFAQNYRNTDFGIRYLNNSVLSEGVVNAKVNANRIEKCVFYGLNGMVDSNCNGCAFVDSAISFYCAHGLSDTYTNCLFYGNNNSFGQDIYSASRFVCAKGLLGKWESPNVTFIRQDPNTGDTYIALDMGILMYYNRFNMPLEIYKRFANYLGGDFATISTAEEMDFVKKNLVVFDGGTYLDENYDGMMYAWQADVPGGIAYYAPRRDQYYDKPIYKDTDPCISQPRASIILRIPNTEPGVELEINELTEEYIKEAWETFRDAGKDAIFYGNAIINRIASDKAEDWIQIQGVSTDKYTTEKIGYNYWGTEGLSDKVKKEIIEKQIFDFDDYQELSDLITDPVLETAPEEVWPVVRTAEVLNAEGQPVSTVGNEKVTFRVTFNRDMDTDIPLRVRFGSSYPYADYEIEGEWEGARTWSGTSTLTTLISNGNQCWSIDNGRSAEGHLKLYKDWGRFTFKIDTTAALAMNMQAEATDSSIKLTWFQDDFETLAGYNVYRADYEDGQYNRINTTLIPADVKEFIDTNIVPGEKYYYNFTVVKTDLSESEPSGKVSIRAKDTVEPGIYHDMVFNAFAGNKIIVKAYVWDNLQVSGVELFYRMTGAESWKTVPMTVSSDRYSAIIPGSDVTTAGLEYYIRAFDGTNYSYCGTDESPFVVQVQETVDSRSMGDVNLDGQINVLDALMVLQAINDRLNLTAEQFARADLNGNGQLEALEVLTILQYANGTIGSVLL